jgi:tRNA1(Val) A37 N6-methylase TrmN6
VQKEVGVVIEQFLNKRCSLRKLSDNQFESLLPQLALELEGVDYHTQHEHSTLLRDWKALCHWQSDATMLNSTSRIRMKLCEHFFPGFYEIENARGQSFAKLWTRSNLEKVLRWNRKSHSTPYLSELKRGIYFCCGLTKNTMYRPQMMKLACMNYAPGVVFDPCAGWGGRLLGAVSYGAKYIAFEPNNKTYGSLNALVDFLGIRKSVTLICDDALNMGKYDLPHADMVLTSPPYYDLEVYTHEPTQSITGCRGYEEWSNGFLKPLVQKSLERLSENGESCWNVGKVGKYHMGADIVKYHQECGYHEQEVLSLISSKRQPNQVKGKSTKTVDDTVVFRKIAATHNRTRFFGRLF